MIFVIPLVLVAAILALRGAKRDFQVAGAQGRWFLAWSAAGAATTFSVLTGLSVGVFVLPFAALLLSWVARRSRHLLDADRLRRGDRRRARPRGVPEPLGERTRSAAVARGRCVPRRIGAPRVCPAPALTTGLSGS
jgi:hypothetical protein